MAFALAAGISGASSLISGLLGSNASSQAAKEQQQASQNAINFDTNLLGLTQTADKPYSTLGYNALSQLGGLINPGNMNSTLENLPGFQFQSKWGTKATQNALTAQGLGGSTGPLAQGISNYNQGLAGTYFNNFFNQEMGAANLGFNANQAMTGAQTATAGLGNQQFTNSGNAAAAGTLGSAAGLSNGLTGAAGSGANALLLNQLLSGQSNGGIFSGGNILSGVNTNGIFSGLSDSEFDQ